MAVLFGPQQIADFMKANPNSGISNPLAGYLQAPKQQDYGLLGNILGGVADNLLINPSTFFAENVNRLAQGGADNNGSNQMGYVNQGVMGGGNVPMINESFGASPNQQTYQPMFMSPEEQQNMINDPLGIAARRIAGAGSFLVGGGSGTLGSAIGHGALAGTLQGFAGTEGQDTANTLLNTGAGGLMGGVMGGGINLAGKGLNAAAGKVKNIFAERAANKLAPGASVGGTPNLEGVSAADQAKMLQDTLTGDLNNKNPLQQTGIKMQATKLGFTAGDDAKGFAKLDEAVARSRQLTDFFGEKFNQRGIENAAGKAKQLVDNVAEQSDLTANTSQLFHPEVVDELARNAKISPEEASAAIRRELSKALGFSPETGGTLKQIMGDAFDVKASDLLTAKRATYDVADKVFNKGSEKASDLAGDIVHNWAQRNLEQIPGIADLNKSMAMIASQKRGLARTFNTGQAGAVNIASPSELASKIYNLGMGKAGQVLEGVGNLEAKLGGKGATSAIQGGKVISSTNPFNAAMERILRLPEEEQKPLMQQLINQASKSDTKLAKELVHTAGTISGLAPQANASGLLSKVTPAISGALNNPALQAQAGQQILGGLSQQPTMIQPQGQNQMVGQAADLLASRYNLGTPMAQPDQNGQVQGMSTGGMPESPMFGSGGTGSPGMGGAIPGSTGPNRQMLIMNLLSAGVKPAEIKNIADLIAPAAAANKNLTPAAQRDVANIQTGMTALDDIGGIIKKDNMALVGSTLPGFMQPSNAKQLGAAINQLTDVVGRMRSGGQIGPKEMETFRGMLPIATDDPQTIDYKISRIRSFLQDAKGAYETGAAGSGATDGGGEDSTLALLSMLGG